MVDKASVEGELGDRVCEIADASASFKCDRWKHFGFLMSRNEKDKVTDSQRKNNILTLLDNNEYTPRTLF